MHNYFGNENDKILIQEYIDGPEFVVNTISCQGKHILSDMWEYTKIQTHEGEILYQSSNLVHELDSNTRELVDYTMKVLDAEHFEFGPCHGEFKIDHNGPILIETNPRPMGDSMSRSYMLDICGQCIVDWSLDSMLKQDEFLQKINENNPYKALLYSRKKYVIYKEEMTGDMSSGFEIVHHLKTFHNHNEYGPAGIKTYPKTHDLGDTPMILKLAGKNYEDVYYDTDAVKAIERHYPQLMCCAHPYLDKGKEIPTNNLAHMAEKLIPNTSRVLIVHKCGNFVINNGVLQKAENLQDKFDGAIYANTKADTLTNKIKEIFIMFGNLHNAATAKLADEVAEMIPYGQDSFNVLKHVARLN